MCSAGGAEPAVTTQRRAPSHPPLFGVSKLLDDRLECADDLVLLDLGLW